MKKLIFLALVLFPLTLMAKDYPKGDGKLVIFNYHLNELLETQFRNGDQYNDIELAKIQHLFRSKGNDTEHEIDIRLIDFLDHVQDHFGADQIELISGYRSPEYNQSLKSAGKNVATESLHLEGRAADIHIDEVTEKAVAEYVRSLRFGGVGYYPINAFVHIDTGPVKNWDTPKARGRRLIGTEDEYLIVTDKNVYFPGEEIRMSKNSPSPGLSPRGRGKEKFIRGKWKPVKNFDSFGKFRIKSGKRYSNEFYRKKF